MPRLIWCLLVGLMLAFTATAVLWKQEKDDLEDQRLQQAWDALKRLEREVRIRAATKQADLNGRGWPSTIDPSWFTDEPPLNPYVSRSNPWVEVAGPDEADARDPAIRQAISGEIGSFWYNPSNGVVRARVGTSVLDSRALDLYNRLNGSSVDSLFGGGSATAAVASER